MGPVGDMEDYEHLRPVLHTDSLRISYGAVKGRGDTDWQKQCAGNQPLEMVRELQRRGFSAILINRKAYPDKAEDLRRQLEKVPLKTLTKNDDFMVFELPNTQ
jgi:phosphoglycerol transferase